MAHGQSTKREWPEGRKEPRVPARIEVHLRKGDGSNLGEILFTENVCCGGVGLVAGNYWKPGQEVLLKSTRLGFIILGQISYCQRVGERRFAVGVKILSGEGNWLS